MSDGEDYPPPPPDPRLSAPTPVQWHTADADDALDGPSGARAEPAAERPPANSVVWKKVRRNLNGAFLNRIAIGHHSSREEVRASRDIRQPGRKQASCAGFCDRQRLSRLAKMIRYNLLKRIGLAPTIKTFS